MFELIDDLFFSGKKSFIEAFQGSQTPFKGSFFPNFTSRGKPSNLIKLILSNLTRRVDVKLGNLCGIRMTTRGSLYNLIPKEKEPNRF
ncbi:hypothetical protein [Ammoniphilus sp. 3BR4]|uniref:hypothetical protein n=1 Tax=Ammoniphilus sp. 3BR4 TaxID=3158265 RepID=UPI003466B8AB